MGASDTMAKLRSTALATIERNCFGEDFAFDATTVVAPTPAGGVMVAYTLILTTRSPLLGQGPLMNVMQIPSPAPTAEQVEQVVIEGMKGLRALSTKILSGEHAAAVDPR